MMKIPKFFDLNLVLLLAAATKIEIMKACA